MPLIAGFGMLIHTKSRRTAKIKGPYRQRVIIYVLKIEIMSMLYIDTKPIQIIGETAK